MSETTNIKVVVRVRPAAMAAAPPLSLASDDGTGSVNVVGPALAVDDASGTISLTRDKRKGTLDFRFSHVMGPGSSQAALYSAVASNLVRDVADGINCCIMAYGQTSSGKSHAMVGTGWDDDAPSLTASASNLVPGRSASFKGGSRGGMKGAKKDVGLGLGLADSQEAALLAVAMHGEHGGGEVDGEGGGAGHELWPTPAPPAAVGDGWGVIPRSLCDLFAFLDGRAAESERFEFAVNCQIMQIYNEKIYDLLQVALSSPYLIPCLAPI